MKPSPRDYLAIIAALLAILLCGYGIGFLVGERTTRQRLARQPDPAHSQLDWESATLDRLTAELGLDESQQRAVELEIRAASQTITAARNRALHDYRQVLADLHDRLLPHLNPRQQQKIEESRRALKKLLDEGG